MRYPILSFDGDDLFVFENPDDVSRNLEVYDVDYPEVLFDSDGRLLIKTLDRNEVTLSDSGAEPDPERLRSMLIHALRKRGQEWADDAPLESLVSTAQDTWDKNVGVVGFAEAITRLLRRFRLRKPPS